MTKNKTIGLWIASFCLSIAIAIPTTLAAGNSFVPASATAAAKSEMGKRSSWEPSSTEVEANPDKLSALTISSTITPSSHSFTFTFSTGGQGYTDTTSNYLIAPSDEDYQATIEAINKLDAPARSALDKLNSLDENFDAIPNFNAYIFSISPTLGKTIVLPKTIYRNHLFGLTPSYIGVGAYDFSKLPDFKDPVDLTQDIKIYIPSNIKDVFVDSFLNLDAIASRVHFYVELTEAEVEERWDDDWNHGAPVVYNYQYADHSDVVGLGSTFNRIMEHEYDDEGAIIEIETENVTYPGLVLAIGGASSYGDENANFFLGYLKPGNELPLYLEYQVEIPGQPNDTRYEQFLIGSRDGYYNSVGSVISRYSTTMSIDIPVAGNEKVDIESLIVHNIYAKKATLLEPDESVAFYIAPRNVFAKSYNLDEFIDISFKGVSHFMGYTSIKADISKKDASIYETLNPSGYRTNAVNLESGQSYIRYRITSLPQSKYLVGFNDEIKEVSVKSPITQYVLSSKVNKITYILKDTDIASNYDPDSLESLDFIGFYVSIDVYGKNGPLARSNVSTRFGIVNVMPKSAPTKVFSADTLLIWLTVGFVAAYLLGSIGLFFFKKERYKNDEFRRLKPKKFITTAVLGLLGSLIVILGITFIILRSTLFSNAIVVYNPVDPFIIVFMIASVLILGYFIKYIVVQSRIGSQRRKALKLKLDEDVAEDGTN